MRDASDDLAAYLLESCSYRIIVDVFYADERTWTNVPVTDWELDWDLESATKFTGSLTVVHQGDTGDSRTPKKTTDLLAPFGQEVNVLLEVSFGSIFTETLLLGRFRITEAPRASDDWFGFDGRPYVLASSVQLTIGDLLTIPERKAFRGPSVPSRTDSTWTELQFLSGLPIEPNLPDQPTPANLVYPPGAGQRLTVIQQLMSQLGGIAVTNEFGELTAVPYTAGGPVTTLEMSTRGQVVSVEDSVSTDQLVNEVTGEYQDDDGNPIYAWAVVSSGPLSVDGPLGTCSADPDSDDTVSTVAAARSRVEKLLRQYLGALTSSRTITCVLDPRLQQGDVVNVNGPRTRRADGSLSDPAWTSQSARVSQISMGSNTPGLMTVTLDESAAVTASIRVGP